MKPFIERPAFIIVLVDYPCFRRDQ